MLLNSIYFYRAECFSHPFILCVHQLILNLSLILFDFARIIEHSLHLWQNMHSHDFWEFWVALFKDQDQIVSIYVDMPPYSLDPMADFSSNHSFNAYFYSLILFCLIWAYNLCVLLFIMWMIGIRPVESRRVCILMQLLLMNQRSFIVQFTQSRL